MSSDDYQDFRTWKFIFGCLILFHCILLGCCLWYTMNKFCWILLFLLCYSIYQTLSLDNKIAVVLNICLSLKFNASWVSGLSPYKVVISKLLVNWSQRDFQMQSRLLCFVCLFVLLCLIEAYETECNGETVTYMKMEFPFLLSSRDVSFSNAYYYPTF